MAQHRHIPWDSVELEHLNPLLRRQFVVGENVMVARVLLKRGCVVPLHSHHNEQVTYILEGALKFGLNGEEVVVRAGEVLCIPSNVPHQAVALENTSRSRHLHSSTRGLDCQDRCVPSVRTAPAGRRAEDTMKRTAAAVLAAVVAPAVALNGWGRRASHRR